VTAISVHKRVKRLVHLKLVEQINEHFERGAKHYKITPYGLITYIGNSYNEAHEYTVYNIENIVIQSLLLGRLEEETIYSIRSLKEFPTDELRDYLHDCSSITVTFASSFGQKLKDIV
jgi:hypothetical protein